MDIEYETGSQRRRRPRPTTENESHELSTTKRIKTTAESSWGDGQILSGKRLHNEMLLAIFSYLDLPSLIVLRFVCRIWYRLQPNIAMIHNLCVSCAEHGHLGLMKWFHRVLHHPWCISIAAQAARKGHLQILEYMESVHWMREAAVIEARPLLPCNSVISVTACLHGRINILEWLKRRYDYKFEDHLTDIATDLMDENLLEWLLKNNCRWHFGKLINNYTRRRKYDKLKWMIDVHERLFAKSSSN
jgi:hypothetical protein